MTTPIPSEPLMACSVCRELEVVPGGMDDYNKLARYHYRHGHLGPYAAIFALRPTGLLKASLGRDIAGVIVYTTATAALELRNVATGGFFAGADRSTALSLVNKNIRRIARVVIEPRFRGLGLAIRLVRETMPQLNVPVIEAMAVMGIVNPFFEKAGMQPYTAKTPARCVRLIEALSAVGIEDIDLIDARAVQQKIEGLNEARLQFIEREIGLFLQGYGRRRYMPPGPDRTRYILSKLTERPVYYLWFNPEMELRI